MLDASAARAQSFGGFNAGDHAHQALIALPGAALGAILLTGGAEAASPQASASAAPAYPGDAEDSKVEVLEKVPGANGPM